VIIYVMRDATKIHGNIKSFLFFMSCICLTEFVSHYITHIYYIRELIQVIWTCS